MLVLVCGLVLVLAKRDAHDVRVIAVFHDTHLLQHVAPVVGVDIRDELHRDRLAAGARPAVHRAERALADALVEARLLPRVVLVAGVEERLRRRVGARELRLVLERGKVPARRRRISERVERERAAARDAAGFPTGERRLFVFAAHNQLFKVRVTTSSLRLGLGFERSMTNTTNNGHTYTIACPTTSCIL